MKSKLHILSFLLFCFTCTWAQTALFTETMGIPSGTTIIATNVFSNSNLQFSNGSQTSSADIRNTNASPSNLGLSGGGNVFFTSTSGAYGFSIEGINASNYSSLSLQYGYRKESASVHAAFSVDYWNGTSWESLANTTSALFNEAANASAVWYVAKTLLLPTAAQINGLKIRFVKTGNIAIRIDDVKLTGVLQVLPTVVNTTATSVTANSATFSGNVTATGGNAIIATGTVYALTTTNSNPTIGGIGVTTLNTQTPNSGTGTFLNNSGGVLLSNVQYSYNVFATKSGGFTGYGTAATFYTLASTPNPISISNPTINSLNISIANDSNSPITTYSIFESSTSKYVQLDGTLGTTEVFQTKIAWGSKIVSGLNPTTTYSFQARAKNGDEVVTAFSSITSGTTLTPPSIVTTGSITALNTTYGTASPFGSFTVSGNNLSSNIVINVPNGFEVSITPNGLNGYASSQVIYQTMGTVNTTTIYIRLAATAGFGSYSGNVVLTSANDLLTVNVPIISSNVAKLIVFITGISVNNKAFDGNTSATISGFPILEGVLESDSNTISLFADNATANFVDSSIGDSKPIIITGYTLTGIALNNYELIQPAGLVANITASSALSDFIMNYDSPTNNNSNIDYKTYQGTLLTNTGSGVNGSIGVMGFYLRDGGEDGDTDNLPTELTSLSFQIINPHLIKAARLFVGTSPRGDVVSVNGNSVINFTGLTNIIAQDNGQLALNLRVTFNSDVTDNEQVIFIITNATANAIGSTFASPDGGGITSVSDGDINRIEVSGQRLYFQQQPPFDVIINTAMSPSPTLVVKDVYGNIDLDFNNSVFINSSGTTNLNVYLPNIFTDGIYTFDNIIHTASGNNLYLGAGSSSLTNGFSTTFNVGITGTPFFTPINPICSGAPLVLPTTSANGINGSWSPNPNSTETTTYTFTPNPGQNAIETTMTVIVNPNTIPIFTAVAPINIGNSLSPLPTTSNNGITGTWSPALDNTQTTTYTFTPNIGLCAITITLTIQVYDSSIIVPTFSPISEICIDTILNELPTISNNGIVGTWSPELNNLVTTTYTFTPNAGQNAISTILTIVVRERTVPTFNSVPVIAYGVPIDPNILPTTSINGIIGSWYPNLTNVTATYLFTPNNNQCASTASLTIEVMQPPASAVNPLEDTIITNPDGTTQIIESPICLTDTKGELSVSSSGTPVYKVPIALPPGIKDVAPQLALEYSGSSVQGIAGMGWNLNGISSIMRVSSRLDLDGVIDPVDFDSLDRYALDGQRLIPVSGSYGMSGTNYQTENYSNMKIEPQGNFGTIEGTPLYGPQSFVVTFPDGSQAFYGGTGDSKALSEWKINRWIDPQGNYIDYSYFTENRVTRINKITWGKNINSNSLYENTIEFSYKNRLRSEYSYINGLEIATTSILSHIVVKTGAQVFRTYTIGHENISANYQRVKYILESAGDNSVSNPIYFDYNNTPNNLGDFTKAGSDTGSAINSIDSSGDFDGNGSVDFIANDKVYLNPIDSDNNWYGINLTAADKYIPISIIDNNKLNQFQSVLTVDENSSNNQYKIYSYNKNTNQMILKSSVSGANHDFQYCKSILLNNTSTQFTPCPNAINFKPNGERFKSTYIEGDYNGDGLTEIIHIRPIIKRLAIERSNPFNYSWNNSTYFSYLYTVDGYKTYYINPNTNTVTDNLNLNVLSGRANFSADFNGDGRTDILSVNKETNDYIVYQFNILGIELQPLFSGNFSEKIMSGDNVKQLVFGDFNGDSKTDIMIPLQETSSSWVLRLSTGRSFKYDLYSDFEYYQPFWRGAATANRQRVRTYRAADLNKDGKSDFVTTEWESWQEGINNRDSRAYFRYKENIGSLNTKPTFAAHQPKQINSIYKDPITCLVGEFKNPQANFEFVFIQNSTIWKGQYDKDFEQEATLTKVKDVKNLITTDVTYRKLVNITGLGTVDDVYHSGNTELYPFTEMINVPSMKVVDKITVNWTEGSKSQLYKYAGLVIHSTGLGVLGFKKIAKSSWFNDINPTKIWSCVQSNPQLLGQKVHEWSYSGDVHSSFANPPISNAGPNDLGISSTTFTSNLLLNGIRIIVPNKTVKKDFLSQLTDQTEYFYDNYWNINRTLFTNANGTKEVVNTLYNNPSGAGRLYALGRITQVNETIANYNDTFTTEQKYDYDPTQINLLKKLQKKGHNTDYITEEFEYDVFGNVVQKSVSAPSVTTRVTKDKYDANGRFVLEKTDTEGLVSKLEYNRLGQVIKSTSPFNVVTLTNYNNWGLPKDIVVSGASSAVQKTSITYTRDSGGNLITTSTNLITSEVSRTFINKLGQNFKSTTKGFAAGSWISKVIEYDFLGRAHRTSEPYSDSNPTTSTTAGTKWNTTTYDSLSRPTEQASFNGRTQVITYDGLTTTTTDSVKTIETTYDANGNKRIVKDNNETLNFNYYASGLQKETVYGNHTITYTYDGWGRNTAMLDPSVSPTAYSNTYNNFGELLTATTPTGTSTMTYSPTGRLLQKTSAGQNTNIQSVYTYDAKGLLLGETGTSNGKSFSYTNTYNSLSQLVSKKEITPDNFTHIKTFTFDGQGRILQDQTNSFMTNNPSVNNGNVTIEYGYNAYNGILEQYKDVASSTVLWKLNSANERMQALSAVLGNGMQVTNTYDADYYVKTINHATTTNTALNLEYQFVRDRGTLNWRKNNVAGVLSWNETFSYDHFERLTSWTDPTGTSSNSYENDGRIAENNAVGTYNYGGTSRYRKTTADLNPSGEAHYLTRTPQNISYNMFKSPITISEITRGSVAFEYNTSGDRSKSCIKAEDGTTILKNKWYSGISEVEIIEKPNQSLQFITYIAGSPYDAAVALEKKYTASGSNYTPDSQEYLYLHRDYQGTILAISGNNGTIKERRIFDPWGNLKKKYIGNTAVADASLGLADFEVVTDRGYTGHEHFFSVGIIHMNGRIYDPVMRCFLSADPILQAPDNSQNYNRYAYCFNNPLLYTDPSGNVVEPVSASIVTAVVIGAIIGGVAYVGMSFYTGTFSWGGLAKSIVIGAVSGAASSGIGSVFKSLSSATVSATGLSTLKVNLMLTLPRAMMHGIAQGLIQGISGGDAEQSFLTAAISSIAAGGYGMAAGDSAQKGAGMVLFGTFAGGATAALTGGNFWEGAVSGLVVSLLNHAAHEMTEDGTGDPPNKYKKWFSARVKEINEWGSNVKKAAGMTFDWATGNAPKETFFIGGKVANALRSSIGITRARNEYYNKGVTSGGTTFGVKDFLSSGLNPIQQFVGSFYYKIIPVGNQLFYSITNYTSMNSAFYHLYPSSWSPNSGAMSTTSQTYIFSEPMRKN